MMEDLPQPGNPNVILINGLQMIYNASVNYVLTINKAINQCL